MINRPFKESTDFSAAIKKIKQLRITRNLMFSNFYCLDITKNYEPMKENSKILQQQMVESYKTLKEILF